MADDHEPNESDSSTDDSASTPDRTGEDNGIVRAVLTGGTAEPAAPDGSLDALVRGTTVGSYVILSQLSNRDGDNVYAAFDARLDRKVALKLVEVPEHDDDEADQIRDAVITGIMRSGGLDHPAIVEVLDAGTIGEAIYVAMEFIDGIDLRQWMEARDEPFPWPEVLRVFREAGSGLAAAHAAGCIHGDFTPSRVFMEKSGRICVVDFGLATPVAEVSSPRLTVEGLKEGLGVSLTKSSDGEDSIISRPPRAELVGTPRYLAPELHAGIEPDAKADQFAFCAAMYEALYGEVPFKGDTPESIAAAALAHSVRPAPEGSDVPLWLREVLLKGMSPRRRDRYASMEMVLRHLEHDPDGRRRRWLAGVGVLVGVAAAASGVAYLVQREASRCEADTALLDGAWDPDTRVALEEAFLATGRPHAPDSWAEVQASMDDWSSQWFEYYSLACKVRQADDDDALLARRNACLDGVLQPFATFANTTVEEGASASAVEGAQRVVTGLWRPADCRSGDMLDYAEPSDSPAKLEVDQAWLLLLAGDAQAAQLRASHATENLSASEDPSAFVRAKLVMGLAAARSGAPEAAALLHEAASIAAAASLRIPQAEAWIALSRYDVEPARAVALEHATTLVDAIKLERLRAQLFVAQAAHQHSRGQDRDALASYHRALALLQDSDTRTTILRADILFELGELANTRQEWSTASQYLVEVITLRESTFGPAHPELVSALQGLGVANAGANKHREAARSFDRALVIAKQSSLSPDTLASLHVAMGKLETAQDQHSLAAAHYADAVTALDGTKSDAQLADALLGLGLAHLEGSANAQATAALERASVLAGRVGWTGKKRASLYEALGRSLIDVESDAAAEAFREALETATDADAVRIEELLATLGEPAPSAP
ncbi:MAG: protein kinase domain-containing protein [Nannocystales bacterium]